MVNCLRIMIIPMRLHILAAALGVLLTAPAAGAQTPDTVLLEELTWTEVRDAIRAGKTTIIIPVGGTEQNGPHMALGKHKSFVSQITNPAYSVPIPATDLATIFEICHLSPAEREQFLTDYRAAHPDRASRPLRAANAPHELRIALPKFETESRAREVEAMERRRADEVTAASYLWRRAQTVGGPDGAR